MSREIPQDQPLTEEDRRYLVDRGRDSLVARIDEEQGVEDGSDEVDDEVTDWTDPSWTVAELVNEINARNARRSTVDGMEPLSTKGTKAELGARLDEDTDTPAA